MQRAVHWSSWYLTDLFFFFFLPQQFCRSMQSVVHCSSWYLMNLCSLTILEEHATGIWRIFVRSQQFWRSMQYTALAGICRSCVLSKQFWRSIQRAIRCFYLTIFLSGHCSFRKAVHARIPECLHTTIYTRISNNAF